MVEWCKEKFKRVINYDDFNNALKSVFSFNVELSRALKFEHKRSLSKEDLRRIGQHIEQASAAYVRIQLFDPDDYAPASDFIVVDGAEVSVISASLKQYSS